MTNLCKLKYKQKSCKIICASRNYIYGLSNDQQRNPNINIKQGSSSWVIYLAMI